MAAIRRLGPMGKGDRRMNIELASASQNLLKITWALYSADIEAEIVRRLETVPGIEGRPRRYYAPVIQCERLMQLFSHASFAYEAMCAADKAARDFFDSLIGTGVKLVIDGDKVKAIGDNVSPLLAQLVDDRSPALMSLVQLEVDREARHASLESSQNHTEGQGDDLDPKLELLAKGIANAQKRAEIEAQFRYGKRRSSKKPTQGNLGL